ncbi:MAG: TatD family hydrolase [Pelolinea sp.]|nr:TatD family hydrolase [Pelolinea sp.]
MASLFDTHCHLYDPQFSGDRDAVVDRYIQNQGNMLLVPGEDRMSSLQALQLCARYKNLAMYVAAGIHPHHAERWKGEIADIKMLLKTAPGAAVGEIGLDYYRMLSQKDAQLAAFKANLELASEFERPIIVHSREATDDLLSIMDEWICQIPVSSALKERPGVFHAYNGDPHILEFALSCHFFLGIGGPITYKNAEILRAALRKIPLDRILVETDSPFLAPHPNRGKRNEPAYVRFVAEKIAQVLALPAETVCEQTTLNAIRLFGDSNAVK